MGKDQRDHAGHIDHQGQVAAHRHGHAVADPAAREEHRHIAPALLDEDDREDGQDQDGQDDQINSHQPLTASERIEPR